MRIDLSVLRVGAVVLAIALGGGYVWFRAAPSRYRSTTPTPPSSVQASAPATAPSAALTVMSGSKFSRMAPDPYPDANTIGSGFKLNNSISAEFAVGSDVKAGVINLMPNSSPATQPTTPPRSK